MMMAPALCVWCRLVNNICRIVQPATEVFYLSDLLLIFTGSAFCRKPQLHLFKLLRFINRREAPRLYRVSTESWGMFMVL
jgi:hypothetical protein